MNLGGWALAWYSTVEQLKEALANTQVRNGQNSHLDRGSLG